MGKNNNSSRGITEVDIEPGQTKKEKRERKAAKDSASLDSKSKPSSSKANVSSEPKMSKTKAKIQQVVTMSRENSRRQASAGKNHEDEYFYERVETVTSSSYPNQSQKGKEKLNPPSLQQYPSKDSSEYAGGTSTSAEEIRYANRINATSAGGPSLPDFGSLRISEGYQEYDTTESRGPQRYEQPEVSHCNWNQCGGSGSASTGGTVYGESSHYNTSRDYESYNGQTNYQGNIQPLNSYGPGTGYTNYQPQSNTSYLPVQVHNPYDTGNYSQNPYTTQQAYAGNAPSSYLHDMLGNSVYTEPSNLQALPTPNQYDRRGGQMAPTVIVQITNAESVQVADGREKDGKKQKKKKSSKSYGSNKGS